MNAFGNISAGPWQLVEVIHGHDGKSVLQNPDGTVVSIQPGGIIGTRPPGTYGPWEECVISDGIAVYTVEGQCWPFGIREA